MKVFISKWVSAAFLAALIVVFISSAVQAKEKKKISGTAKATRVISQTISEPGDKPQHKFMQIVREDTLTSTDPDWNNVKSLNFEQFDLVAGNGSGRGYKTFFHNNGDVTYETFTSTHKMVKGGAAWEISVEGSMQCTGGTGKFKDGTCSVIFKGTMTPTESMFTWEAEVEY